MAHARREHFEAQSSDIMRSTVALAYIHLLYDVKLEAREAELDATERQALRQARSRPILTDLIAYLDRAATSVAEEPHWPGDRVLVIELGCAGSLLRRGRSGNR